MNTKSELKLTDNYGNRTKWGQIRSVIIQVIDKIGGPRMAGVGRHEAMLPVNRI